MGGRDGGAERPPSDRDRYDRDRMPDRDRYPGERERGAHPLRTHTPRLALRCVVWEGLTGGARAWALQSASSASGRATPATATATRRTWTAAATGRWTAAATGRWTAGAKGRWTAGAKGWWTAAATGAMASAMRWRAAAWSAGRTGGGGTGKVRTPPASTAAPDCHGQLAPAPGTLDRSRSTDPFN